MRSWLLALSGYKAGSREKSPLDNNKKGKYIHKTFGKRAFKEHIKARMPSIIGRSLKPS